MEKSSISSLSMRTIFSTLAATIVVATATSMVTLTKLKLTLWEQVYFNIGILMLFILPAFYLLAYRPLKRYINERSRMEADLNIIATAFETHEGILIADANNLTLRVNHAFSKTTGYSSEEVIGKTPSIFSAGLHDEAFYQDMWAQIKLHGTWQGEILDQYKNGEIHPLLVTITGVKDSNNQISHYVIVHTNVSAIGKVKNDLARAGMHDPLTGLPNRLQFSDCLHAALAQDNTAHMLAVVMIDLDFFKPINDTYGHAVGDKVLMEVASQLKLATRETDVIARLGGDEFVILLNELTSIEACEETLERLRVALCNPYLLDDLNLNLSASIGATLYPADNTDADGLLRHADEAMYMAKHGVKTAVYYLTPQPPRIETAYKKTC